MAIEGQNHLQERQILALELLAGSVDWLVTIQLMVMEDACRQSAWQGFGLGLGLGREEGEQDGEEEEEEQEDKEEEKIVDEETMKETEERE